MKTRQLLIYIVIFHFLVAFKINAQNIKLLNPHSLDPNGRFLHNGAFGSIFNLGPTAAKIDFLEAQNNIESWNRMATKYMIVDRLATNNGNDRLNSLIFGGDNSGEYILSKRNGGVGQYGLDFLTNFKFRMHLSNTGTLGIGTNGTAASIAQKGRVHIHNMSTDEKEFQKDINLYTSSSNEFFDQVQPGNLYSGQRAGIINQMSNSSVNTSQANSSLQLFKDILPSGTINPSGNTGIVNNLRNLTAPNPVSGNNVSYRHTYGIINDLNDNKIAKFSFTDPWGTPISVYNARIGLLSATNTNNIQEFGSGKIAGWFVNKGGRTSGTTTTPGYMDGWGIWVDGATFLQSSPWTTSDEKLKQNISSIKMEEGLKKILQLNPVQYAYKTSPDVKEIGFISQEVQKYVPEAVVKAVNPATGEEILAMQYNQLISLAISAIQAQQKQIEALEKKLEVRK